MPLKSLATRITPGSIIKESPLVTVNCNFPFRVITNWYRGAGCAVI